jgi:polyhydroxyalkanoate synthesis repressor PhaR
MAVQDVGGAARTGPGRKTGRSDDKIVIKKYANRRLYNTGSSSYVTLENLAEMVKVGTDFVVFDAKTNEDITRQVLTQIIFEEENASGSQNLLPIQFLRQLISFYGDQMQSFVPSYLEMSLDAFKRQQERMREQLGGTFGGSGALGQTPGFGLFDEQVRQNLALFDRAIKMFTPPFVQTPGAAQAKTAASEQDKPADAAPDSGEIADMKSQLEAMQRQIEKLAGGKT